MTTKTDTEQERADFEAWHIEKYDSTFYCEAQWKGWQARAAIEADRIQREDQVNDDRDQLRAEIVALKGTIADLEADRLRQRAEQSQVDPNPGANTTGA